MRLGDLDALKEDFKSRLADCNEWIEKAKDKETKIRASAVKAFIGEVIMSIDNAPTVEINKIEHKAYNNGFKDGVNQGIKLEKRPTGEWLETNWQDEIWGKCKECPFCHEKIISTHYNFCSNCGAEMRGKEE